MRCRRARSKKLLPNVMSIAVVVCAMAIGTLPGCGPADTPGGDQAGSTPEAGATETGAIWTSSGSYEDATIEVTDEAIHLELEAAIARARETADEARQKWTSLAQSDQEKWLIKWEAPITDEESASDVVGNRPFVEYVWVRPLHWSRFRVEGQLVSEPVSDIGFVSGDLVSFPIEELADWIYKVDGTMHGPRQGGFTVEVLEKHFGAPKDG